MAVIPLNEIELLGRQHYSNGADYKNLSLSTLVDLQKVLPSAKFDIVYATKYNFTNKILYSHALAFSTLNTALKLIEVQRELNSLGLNLILYDAYRPLSVQKIMFEFYPDPSFIAHPDIGSNHNRAAAVDVSLTDLEGNLLQMPSDFDEFSKRAHRKCSDLPSIAIKNRDLLESIMLKNGFSPLITEWWHFNDSDCQQYPVLDVSLKSLA